MQSGWLIPAYGLIGAIATLPWSVGLIRRTGQRPAAYLNLVMTVLAFIHGIVAFKSIWGHGPQELNWDWFQAADLTLHVSFELSVLNLGIVLLITGLSLLAQFFCLGLPRKRLGSRALFLDSWASSKRP